METRHVAVLREEDIATLAAQLDSPFRNGKCVACGVATNDQRNAPDVPLRGRSEPLDPIGGRRQRRERLETNNLLSNPEDVVRFDLNWDVSDELLIDTVERFFILHTELAGTRLAEGGVSGREVAVATEYGAGL